MQLAFCPQHCYHTPYTSCRPDLCLALACIHSVELFWHSACGLSQGLGLRKALTCDHERLRRTWHRNQNATAVAGDRVYIVRPPAAQCPNKYNGGAPATFLAAAPSLPVQTGAPRWPGYPSKNPVNTLSYHCLGCHRASLPVQTGSSGMLRISLEPCRLSIACMSLTPDLRSLCLPSSFRLQNQQPRVLPGPCLTSPKY